MTVTALTSPAPRSAALALRPSVTKLSPTELATLRSAIAGALKLNDERGYEYFANWHGVTLGYCRHHEDLFLPWHRAYLYYFELALREVEPTLALPWWDWTASADIPSAYTDATDPAGNENVLLKAPVEPWAPGVQHPAETFRKVGQAPVEGPPYDLTYVMAATSYKDFEERLWEVHDGVHVWVGGTMGNPDWAAYDPLFWAHHTMVDRVWRIWQHNTPGASPPANILDTPLEPRGMRVRDTLEVRTLGYDYVGTASSVAGTTGSAGGASAVAPTNAPVGGAGAGV